MFGTTENKNKVSWVVKLQIHFDLFEVKEWLENNFKEDFRNGGSTDWSTPRGVGYLNYTIDLLPNPNGEGIIFYHRHRNAFSNYLDFRKSLSSYSDNSSFEELSENIGSIICNLANESLMVSVYLPNQDEDKDNHKTLFAMPTKEIFRLQTGESLAELKGEENINFELSENEKIKLNRDISAGRYGIHYNNRFCQVSALIPRNSMNY
jgi:hypothetical protein